ncbi:PKD-like family lipoprotein [Butyricimonas paravirosa]|uniref:PKD-like family lipoprotein n=1 Tax=Butyricimonas paravirosa TaxID=1472417 RepID=UPI00210A320A|nr:PKD-like family lipoprotein [Butyricimonas paravirosa]MCQ4874671.1 PKD-like family lipoprotein [Butyricimonas paravirosa]
MKRLIYILSMLLLASCYDDKGNYDYKEINVLNVTLDEVYSVRLDKDTIVTITPKLSQSLQDNEENLGYTWLYSTINHNFYGSRDLDTIGREQSLYFHVDPNVKNLKYEHYFRVNVYDEITGIEYPVNTMIKLIKPYDGAWMVLHSKNGQTELGSIEYIGENIVVQEDAYYKESGKRFAGKPLCLGQYTTSCKYYGTGSSWNMFYVLTDNSKEAGVYCQWKKFEKKDSLSRMVAPMAQTGFDFQNIKMMDGDGSASALLLSGGGVLYQIPRAGKVYKPKLDLKGDVKITLASKIINNALVYDEAGHRFAFYYNTSDGLGVKKYDPLYFSEGEENADLVKAIPIRDGNATGADPNKLSPSQKVLYVGTGYQYDQGWSNMYGYALAKSEDKCFVYEFNPRGFNSADEKSFNAYYQIDIPKGLGEDVCFASTPPYSGIIFYASGNTVYRLDFKQAGGKATVVYTHTGGKVTKMKFARRKAPSEGLYDAYQFDLLRSLGVSFDMGNGKSDFVILNLSATGSIGADSESYPATQIYSDFGEIADFVFI